MNTTKLEQFKNRIKKSIKDIYGKDAYDSKVKYMWLESEDFYTNGQILLTRRSNVNNVNLKHQGYTFVIEQALQAKYQYYFYPRIPDNFSKLTKEEQSHIQLSAHGHEFLGMCECAKDQFSDIDDEPIVNLSAQYVKWVQDFFGSANINKIPFDYQDSMSPVYVSFEGWLVIIMPIRASYKFEIKQRMERDTFLVKLYEFLGENKKVIECADLEKAETYSQEVSALVNSDNAIKTEFTFSSEEKAIEASHELNSYGRQRNNGTTVAFRENRRVYLRPEYISKELSRIFMSIANAIEG